MRCEVGRELSYDGKHKGLESDTINFDDAVDEAEENIYDNMTAEEKFRMKGRDYTKQEKEDAEEDFKQTRRAVSRLPLHRASPPWGAPNALWKILWMPSWRHSNGAGGGIGSQEKDLPKLCAPTFYRRLQELSQIQRKTGFISFESNRSMGCYIQDGSRLVHVVCGMSSAFFRILGARQQACTPMWEHGFEDGRRREDAMMVWSICSWRLAAMKVDNISTAHDLIAAFHCPSYDDLEQNVVDGGIYMKKDENFARQMLFQTTTNVECADGNIDLKNGVGVLMGTSRAPKDFNHVLRPRVLQWNRECENLIGSDFTNYFCKITGTTGDLSFTKFADDLHKRVQGDSAEQAVFN